MGKFSSLEAELEHYGNPPAAALGLFVGYTPERLVSLCRVLGKEDVARRVNEWKSDERNQVADVSSQLLEVQSENGRLTARIAELEEENARLSILPNRVQIEALRGRASSPSGMSVCWRA